MFKKNNKPMIGATVFYYDTDYKRETAEKVLAILKKHNMFPSELIYAGKLTNNKYEKINGQAEELFSFAYSAKDVLEIDVANDKYGTDYWRVLWGLTYLKNSRIVGAKAFFPWNTLTIHSAYDRLKDKEKYESFINCVKDLIKALNPFYASIDDVGNKNILLNNAREQYFVPERIQTIYWGNYFGEAHCEKYGFEKIMRLPDVAVEQVGNGIYFSLTESVFDFSSKEVRTKRKAIAKFLQRTNQGTVL